MSTDFEVIFNDLIKAFKLRSIAYAPLVYSSDIKKFESYAAIQVSSLDNSSSQLLSTRPAGCNDQLCGWIVSDGVYTVVNGAKTPIDDSFTNTTSSRAIHFPAWQVAPIKDFSPVVMFDFYSSSPAQKSLIDQLLSTKQTVISDFIRPFFGKSLKPAAVAFGPITSDDPGEPVIAMTAATFSFDDIFRSMLLLDSNHVDCVVSSPTTSYTFSLNGDDVTVRGKGDLHDRIYSKYVRTVDVPLTSSYQIRLYPTQSFFNSYVSPSPKILSGSLVGVVVFVALIFLIYMVVGHRFEHRLMEAVQLEMIASRDARLHNKRIYIRYISHEVSSCYLIANVID